jgi:type II secretory pathway component PulL
MAKALFIDITDNRLNAYIFDVRQGRYELKDSKDYPMAEKYDFVPDMMPGGIEDAFVSLPVSMLNFRVLELPFSGRERIREVLPFELEGMMLGGTDKALIDGIVVGKTDSKYKVLAVYIEKGIIRDLLGKLNSCGVDPAFITSLELGKIVKDFSPGNLLLLPSMDDKERIALAQEEMRYPSVNLRREEFAYTRDVEKTRKSLRSTAVLAIFVCIAVSANLLFQIVTTKNETAALKREMFKSYQELFPQDKNIMNVLYQLKSHMKELSGKEDLFIGADPLNLLWKLAQTDRVSAVFYEITTDKGMLVLKGEAQSLGDIQKIKDNLGTLFDDVNIADSKSSAQGKMLFTITAKEKRA